jgi:hypothetical protein
MTRAASSSPSWPALASLAGTLALSPSLEAQILNIEKKRLEQNEDEYLTGNVGLRFNYHNRSPTLQRPARVMSTGLASHVGYFLEPHAYMLINEYQLHVINENEIVNTGFSHARTELWRRETLNLEAYGQYQYDRPRGLDRRLLAGIGPRLRLIANPTLNLTVGVGAMYEQEHWTHPETGALVTARFVKSTNYLSVRINVSEQVDLNGIVYYQSGYDRTVEQLRQRVSGEANLLVKIIDTLSITSSVTASYETRPIVPIIPLIYSTMNGIQFDF